MILSSRDAWRRGGSAPAWPRLSRTRSDKEETRSAISVVGRAVTCMPKVHESVHLWTFGHGAGVCVVVSSLCGYPPVVRPPQGAMSVRRTAAMPRTAAAAASQGGKSSRFPLGSRLP